MPLSKIPNSAFETPVDNNKIVNDISTLALREASGNNRSFYNSNSQFVDVFQDATGIDTTTNTNRNSSEYVHAFGTSATDIAYNFSVLGYPSVTTNNFNVSGGFNPYMNPVSALAGTNTYPGYTQNYGTNSYVIYDFGQSYEFGSQMTLGRFPTEGSITQFRLEYSTDNSTYTAPNFTGSGQISRDVSSGGTDGGNFTNGDSSGNLNFNTMPTTFKVYTHTFNTPTFTARYIKLYAMAYSGSNNASGYGIFLPHGKFIGLVASGNFTGTTITAPSSVSSMGAIITYQDHSGTNALNTDIVLQLSADGGSNYTTATLEALPDFSTGIKMAKANDVSVTAGTSLKYKISFANQSSGSKEARIRGVSLQY